MRTTSTDPLDESDAWTRRARPAFLYLSYALLLWSIPIDLLGGWRPALAAAITAAMRAYLNALPERLRALRHRLSRLNRRPRLGQGKGGKP